jgi:tetratricopeptide (TPR) repeat protein
MNRFVPPLLLFTSLALGAACEHALAGTRVKRPRIKVPKGRRVFKIPKHWVKCKKCGIYLPPRMLCPNCPPKGFMKCAKCGAFHVKKRKCAYCARKKIPRREARCPVCKKAFNGPVSFNHNDKGGIDRDFCRHSLGKNVVESLVWSCPRCGHTHWCPEMREGKEYPGKFNEKVSVKYARKVQSGVRSLMVKRMLDEVSRVSAKLQGMISEMDQMDIPDWIKYEVGLKCAEARGEDADFLAKLALEGSYACRREMIKAVEIPALSKIIPVLEGALLKRGAVDDEPRTVIKVIVDLLRASEQIELRKKRGRALRPPEKYYLYLRLAGCWDRLGSSDMAMEALKQAGKAVRNIPAGPEVLKPLAEVVAVRKKILKQEQLFRARAVKEMRKALVEDNAYHSGAVMPTVYLLGELYRRQKQYGRARPWLVLSRKMAYSINKKHPLGHLIDETMQLPGMRTAPVEEKEEAAVLALVVKLTGRQPSELITRKPSPETGGPAGIIADPKTCSQVMQNIHKAYFAYVAKNRKAPPNLDALFKAALISPKAASGMKCPECKRALRYRRPRNPKGADELLIWHPRSRKCKTLLLYADGKIKERK